MNELTKGTTRTFELSKEQRKLWRKAWTRKGPGDIIVFLLSLPVFTVFLFLNKPGPVSTLIPLALTGGAVWLYMLACLLVTWKERKFRCVRLTANDVGLTLESVGQPTQVNWYEITDVCSASTNETVLVTKHGNFFVPSDSEWVSDLVQIVRAKARGLQRESSLCMQFSEGFRMKMFMAVSAVVIAVLFPMFPKLALGVIPSREMIAIASVLFLLAVIIWRKIRKIPQMVRANQDGLIITYHDSERKLAWSQIKRMQHIGPSLTIMHTTDESIWLPWFCYEPMPPLVRRKGVKKPGPLRERAQLLQLTEGLLLGKMQ